MANEFFISLKNADGITEDHHLHNLDPGTSMLDAKQMLSSCYPGQPAVLAQKIVFSGRSVQGSSLRGGVAKLGGARGKFPEA